MSEIPQAWVEKAAAAIRERLPTHGGRDVATARAVLAAVLPDAQAAQPTVDRDALAAVLCAWWEEDQPPEGRPCPYCRAETDALIASGVVQDAADVRRAVAEEIADTIRDDLSFHRRQHEDGLPDEYAAGMSCAEGIAREHAEARSEEASDV